MDGSHDPTARYNRQVATVITIAIAVLLAIALGVWHFSGIPAQVPTTGGPAPDPESAQIQTPPTSTVLAISPDGKTLASAGGGFQIQGNQTLGVETDIAFWDAKTGEPLRTLRGHTLPVLGLAFSPDSQQLASASVDNTIRVWNAADGTSLRTIEIPGEDRLAPAQREKEMPKGIAWAKAGPFAGTLVVATAQTLGIWDPATGEPINLWQQKVTRTTLPDGATRIGIDFIHSAFALSADGTRIATVEDEHQIHVWEIGTWKKLAEITGHTLNVKCIALSPDGHRVATGSADGTARVWDIDTGRELSRYALLPGKTAGSTVYAVAFSQDGNSVACAGDGADERDASVFCVHLFDVLSGKEVRMMSGHERRITAVAFETTRPWVWSVAGDDRVLGWAIDAETSRSQGGALAARRAQVDADTAAQGKAQGQLRTLSGHGGAVRGVTLNTDGSLAASIADDGTAMLWDVNTGQVLRRIDLADRRAGNVALSPDGQWLVATGGLRNQVFSLAGANHGADTPGRFLQATGGAPLTMARGIDFSADGRTVAISGGMQMAGRGTAAQFAVFSLENAAAIPATGDEFRGAPGASAFSPDGKLLLQWSRDVEIWDLQKKEKVQTLTGHISGVHCAVWSPDGATVASGAQDGTVRLWDAASGELRTTLPAMGVVVGLAWLPNNHLAAAGLKELILWDTKTGAELRRLTVTESYVYALAASADGRRLATTGADGLIRIWSAEP